MKVKQALAFGWRMNGSADGFEQNHGRFTMEVFWNEVRHGWEWSVWAPAYKDGKREQVIVDRGSPVPFLADAKKQVLSSAAELEREAIAEDKKFR